MKPSITIEAEDVDGREEEPGSPGRFQIHSVRSRRQSTVRFVEGDNVSTASSLRLIKNNYFKKVILNSNSFLNH